MKRTARCVVLALMATLGLSAQNIVGDWQGTIKVGEQDLKGILHVSKNDKGELKATFDSVTQEIADIPIDTITVKDSVVKYEINGIGGKFEGKVKDGGKTIEGAWTQNGQTMPLTYTPAPPAAPKPKSDKIVKPSEIDGEWEGTLDAGGTKLRLMVKIVTDEAGLGGKLYSLDQGNVGIKVTSMTRLGPAFKLEVKAIKGTFEGTLNTELTTIDGTWSQGRGDLPLVLNRKKAGAEEKK